VPVFQGLEEAIENQLARVGKGERVPLIVIGKFTEKQFTDINVGRVAFDLHELAQNEIVFIGRHLFESRAKDGYSVGDMVTQILSALADEAEAEIDRMVSYIQNPTPRADGYGNTVLDRAVFEMTARKPRAELYSVIPKGDERKPNKKAAP
jgi:hypothetical protein